MKLTTLTAQAFKGLTFTLDLKTLNFLVGSNFAGKTARTDAIRFLLLGYLPELGKTNAATFGLASGKEMVVEGTFDNGMKIRRRRYLQGDSVKTDDQVPKEIEESLHIGVMLNAETYFALSDRERVNYVFANCPMPQGWSHAEIIEKVDGVLPNDNETSTKIASTMIHIAGTDNITTQGMVDEILGWLTIEAKSIKAYADRMDKGTQAVATLKAQEASNPIRSIHELDADRAVITADIERLQAEKAKHQEAYNAMTRARDRRRSIQEKTRNLDSFKNRLASLHQRLDEKQLELNAAPAATPGAIETAKELEQSHQNKLRDLASGRKYTVEAVNRNRADLAQIDEQTQCPYCGATGDAWKQIKRTEIDSAIAGLVAKLEQLEAEITAASKETTSATNAKMDLQRAQQAYETLERAVVAVKQDIRSTEIDVSGMQNMLEELAGLPVEDAAVMAAVETAQSALNVQNEELHRIDEHRKQSMAKEQDKKRMAEAATERDKAKADLEIYVTAGKRLREIQGQMVQAAFDPLLNHANSFFSAILKTPIAYNQGEIGTWRDGVWVGHRTFSGTEKAMTYAAIQAALAANSPIRIMLIDELGRLDLKNVAKLQTVVERSLEAGTIDQFVGIDATDRYEPDFTKVPCQVLNVS